MLLLPPALAHGISIAFGLLVGSFLNVVIARVPEGKSIVRPGSRCPGCASPIRWYDNVPVLSFLFLRGKCRKCKAAISVRYPVVELLTALLFLTAEVRFGASLLLLLRDWPFLAILVAVTFIDLSHRIIPNSLSLGGLALGLATAAFTPGLGLPASIGGACLGFGLFYGMAWAYEKWSGRPGLGGGDVKLLAMLGSFLGAQGVLTVILVSSIFGSVAGIAWGIASREGKVMGVSIPYGPFLVVGALYYYLLGDLLWLPFTIPT